MNKPTRKCIADLFFGASLLAPLFLPLVLVSLETSQGGLALDLCKRVFFALILGPGLLLKNTPVAQSHFAFYCLIPTWWLSTSALLLRLTIDLPSRSPSCPIPKLLLLLRLGCWTSFCLLMHPLLHLPTLVYTGLVVAVISIVSVLGTRSQDPGAYRWPSVLGLIVFEHLAGASVISFWI